ncbi:ADP-ribose glycohydrolase OARD1 isoform X4 [Betta splendens]|uniref:ADP-ribose glycohydrolase OARD1 isoform X4 n=1 Tax=Betta splendens TaxID=158456 RepID=A0A6P7LVZ7_BETSP|nr:ADP-ribose glycohydrolase OARD1 isoform X4 [Betta splendens]
MSCEHKKAVPNGQMKPSGDSWRLNYVTGDLFSCSGDEALAHCISEDCRMGAGIAVKFRLKFGGMDELKEQKKQTGECAVLRRERRFVYYLITKKRASQKPTYDNLKLSLEDMKSHCLKNKYWLWPGQTAVEKSVRDTGTVSWSLWRRGSAQYPGESNLHKRCAHTWECVGICARHSCIPVK